MKEKIIEFIKNLPKKYGWKFWACVVFAIICFCSGWSESGFLGALQGLIIGPIAFLVVFYMIKGICKFFGKAGKIAGKTAVAAGKGAVFVTAAGVAANKGESISSAISEGNRALNKTKKLFGQKVEEDDYEEVVVRETPSNNTKEEKQSQPSTPKKEIRKVWTGTYIGRDPRAPKHISVPSSISYGSWPEADEIVEALVNMGYEKRAAKEIIGSINHDWKFS